jgi:epoxyqueuosine reductase QueG
MMNLEMEIKAMAREHGAALVGIASRDRLVGAPPSVDPDYLLPSTRSIISIAIPYDRKAIRDYLAKKDWLAHGADMKRIYQILYTITDHLADFFKEKGFEARGVDPNGVYRPEPDVNKVEMVPDFSHRYGAVAAGLGQLGWSGNLRTPQFGAAVNLASVLTSAELRSDPILDVNPCDRCGLCAAVCPSGFIGGKQSVSVTIAGREYTHVKKRNIAYCGISCGGYHGLGPNKKWSTWSPYRLNYPLPRDEGEAIALLRRVSTDDPNINTRASGTSRDRCFDPNFIYDPTCSNCNIVCWESLEDRNENVRLLLNSGVVVLTDKGGRMAIPSEEAEEVNTPFTVKVAVARQEYLHRLAADGADLSGRGIGIYPTDIAVLPSVKSVFQHE